MTRVASRSARITDSATMTATATMDGHCRLVALAPEHALRGQTLH